MSILDFEFFPPFNFQSVWLLVVMILNFELFEQNQCSYKYNNTAECYNILNNFKPRHLLQFITNKQFAVSRISPRGLALHPGSFETRSFTLWQFSLFLTVLLSDIQLFLGYFYLLFLSLCFHSNYPLYYVNDLCVQLLICNIIILLDVQSLKFCYLKKDTPMFFSQLEKRQFSHPSISSNTQTKVAKVKIQDPIKILLW